MLLYEARRGKRAHPIFRRVFAQGSLRARAAYQSQSGKSGGLKSWVIFNPQLGAAVGQPTQRQLGKQLFHPEKFGGYSFSERRSSVQAANGINGRGPRLGGKEAVYAGLVLAGCGAF